MVRHPPASSTSPAPTSSPRIIFLLGWSRSGSTLLARLLNEAPGISNVGELRWLWAYGIDDGRRCGCGELMLECPFWCETLGRMHGNPDGVRAALARQGSLQQSCARTRQLPGWFAGTRRDEREEYASAYVAALDEAARTAGAHTVVDASKMLPDAAAVLSAAPDRTSMVLLTRDPRAVTFSWQRQKARRDDTVRQQMPKFSSAFSSFQWLAANAGSELLLRRRRSGQDVTIRYEDLATNPEAAVQRIVPDARLPVVAAGAGGLRLSLGVSHSVNGNPDRLGGGDVSIRVDDEWRSALSPRDRMVTTAVASPLLGRYGYPLRTRGS